MLFLKQSTASQDVLIGPFVDSTDGVTAETALTISNTDIRISKNGANIVAKNSGGGTHDENGWYQITLDATDTNTVGRLQIHVNESGALPVWAEFQVLEEDIYDALFASSAAAFDSNADVTVGSIASGAVTAASIASSAVTADKIATDAITAAKIAANAIGASELATDAVAEIADAVWDEDATGHQTTGTFGQAIGDPGANTETIYEAVVTDAAGANIAADIVAMDANVDAILVDTGTTLPGTLTTIEGKIDTVDTNVDAVLVDTGTTIPAQITGLNDLSAADVNAQVLDVVNVDTFAEPTGVPPASNTLLGKLGFIYAALRNRLDLTSTEKTFYDDAGSSLWKKTLSDNGTTYTENEGTTP